MELQKDQMDSEFLGNCLLMENIFENGAIRFKQMPTLKHFAAVKFVTQLWTTKKTYYFSGWKFSVEEFKEFLEMMIDDLSRQEIPDSVHPLLIFVIKGTGLEVLNWTLFQRRLDFSFEPWNFFHLIKWTSRGRIDYRETAKRLILEKGVPDDYKKISTKVYCINRGIAFDDVFLLWFQPFNYFEIFHNYKSMNIPDPIFSVHSCTPGVNFYFKMWYDLTESMKVSFSLVWNDLSEESKWNLFAMGFNPTDTKCYLLSLLNVEQQEELYKIFNNYLFFINDWLWQDYFLPSFFRFFDSSWNFTSFLERMISCMNNLHLEKKILFVTNLIENMMESLNFERVLIANIYSFVNFIKFDDKFLDIFEKLLVRLSSQNHGKLKFLGIMLDNFLNLTGNFKISRELECFRKVTHTLLNPTEYQSFFREHATRFCTKYLIKFINFQVVEEILQLFAPNQELSTLKKEIADNDIFINSIHRALCQSECTFEHLNLVLCFLFSNDKESIKDYKSTTFLRGDSNSLIRNSLLKQLLLTIDIYVNPDFENYDDDDDDEDSDLGLGLGIDEGLVRNFTKPWKLLDSIVKWSLESKDEIKHFKNHFKDISKSKSIVVSLLESSSKLVDGFLEWCFNADKAEIKEFKKEFALSCASEGFVQVILHSMIDRRRPESVLGFISWLDLEPDTLSEVKTRLLKNHFTYIERSHRARRRLNQNLLTCFLIAKTF